MGLRRVRTCDTFLFVSLAVVGALLFFNGVLALSFSLFTPSLRVIGCSNG